MSEKHPEQFTPPAEKSIERIEGIEWVTRNLGF